MTPKRGLAAVLVLWIGLAGPVPAEGLSALARLDPETSGVSDRRDGGAEVALTLSQPVPWRVFTLDDPRRLVLDLSQVDWVGADLSLPGLGGAITGMRSGAPMPGWSRLVLDLGAPLIVAEAAMSTDGAGPARLVLRLDLASEAEFAARAGPPPALTGDDPPPVTVPAVTRPERGVMTVVLDPGHGGDDPGAERGGVREADLMLTFAQELREVLVRAGLRVALTREADVFVPLDARVARAGEAGGDLFLSLHADALAEGRATGATVYTLSDSGVVAAARALAERRDRRAMIAGVDLTGQDDRVAGVLMDLARADTAPRSDALADAIVDGLKAAVVGLHKRPRNEGGFAVLVAPDMPSVLIELGFLSNPRDRARLTDPDWRAGAAAAIRDAILTWQASDAATAGLRRR